MRTGIDARTGQVLTGWPHCRQSIRACLTTRFRTRDMRFHIGSEVPQFQDANADIDTIFDFFVAIATALSDPDSGVPGFRLRDVEVLTGAARSGRFGFLLNGVYFPRGHLGDYTIYDPQSLDWFREAA
jgi:hypothetical protein